MDKKIGGFQAKRSSPFFMPITKRPKRWHEKNIISANPLILLNKAVTAGNNVLNAKAVGFNQSKTNPAIAMNAGKNYYVLSACFLAVFPKIVLLN